MKFYFGMFQIYMLAEHSVHLLFCVLPYFPFAIQCLLTVKVLYLIEFNNDIQHFLNQDEGIIEDFCFNFKFAILFVSAGGIFVSAVFNTVVSFNFIRYLDKMRQQHYNLKVP